MIRFGEAVLEVVPALPFWTSSTGVQIPGSYGTYRIELYFTEPWHGTGGSASTDCEGLRIFDVAVNDSVVLDDLDIWAESGHDGVCKKVVYATVKGGV